VADQADVAVCIPTIPPRAHLLRRAVGSVQRQTLPVREIQVALDSDRQGAATTRNRTVEASTSEWVAFLDDDDEFLPHHIERLVAHQRETGADLVYPWFEVVDGVDPLGWGGRHFSPDELRRYNYIPVTVLVRRELILAGGGFQNRSDGIGGATWEDWNMWLALLDLGATFSHLPERTWRWHFGDTQHTHGRSDRW
jgi:glycosyltransferase involved in cell wall biosynthesis